MKRFMADTVAMVVFSTLLGAFVEIVLSGLEPIQSLWIRLAAIPVMLVTGRPYGLYRDILFDRFGKGPGAQRGSLLIDSFANLTFQVPLYLGLLAWGGASFRQMMIAGTSIAFLAAISGRPYGLFLNACRRLFGVQPDP